MQVCIHRGTQETGSSCVEVISKGKRIIIDLGFPIRAKENGSSWLPEIPGLNGTDKSLLGILVSHGHLDLCGLLAETSPDIPVAIGANMRKVLMHASPFLRNTWWFSNPGIDLKPGKKFSMGPFKITPYLVDHVYDACSFLIEAEGKRLFFSRESGLLNPKNKGMAKLTANPPQNIDLMLLEGFAHANNNHTLFSETEVENKLEDLFKDSQKLILVQASVQNTERIASIYKACKRSNRTLVIDLYTAVLLESSENQHVPQSYWPGIELLVPQKQRELIRDNEWFEMLKRHSENRIFIEKIQKSAGESVILFRPAFIPDLEHADLLNGAAYVNLQDENPGLKLHKTIEKNFLKDILIPASGLPGPAVLNKFIQALKPSKIGSIYTINKEQYKELSPIQVFKNGECLEV